MASPRILLADDHRLFREGVRALLEKRTEAEIVGEADNGREAVRLAEKLAPDLVVMDTGMPVLNGVEATRQIKAALPHVKVLAVSMYSDRRRVLEMLAAGAAGYVIKTAAVEELEEAIDRVLKNGLYVSPSLAGSIIRDHVERFAEGKEPAPRLTPREREVLQLIAEGRPTRAIATALHVSIKTVETHRRQIMAKLGLHSVAEMTKYAIREGLTSLDP